MPRHPPIADQIEEPESDDVSAAPESGQPLGGRDNPWEGEEVGEGHLWPSEHHPPPKDEL